MGYVDAAGANGGDDRNDGRIAPMPNLSHPYVQRGIFQSEIVTANGDLSAGPK